MIGRVNESLALIRVQFVKRDGTCVDQEFVIDTGFEGGLALPISIISSLRLDFVTKEVATLADDTYVDVEVYAARVLWIDELIDVAVLAMGKQPLLGTALLKNCNLNVDFADSGVVTISSLKRIY